ncbi:hypothetical protein AB0I68_28540 [Streptomyces sp. NPDC050448]|uniref:hypothetical protein n=1 Tax=Streptomyces sp. NPDC050448 TaxID=3155404 RepID=UPI0034298A10
MRSTRNVMGTIALFAAMGAGITACGPQEDGAAAPSSQAPSSHAPSAGASAPGASAAAKPSKGSTGGDGRGGENDCGKPPTLPAGVKMIEVGLHRDMGVIEAMDAKPKCTPNDWIYHGEGEPKSYKLPADIKGELALSAGPGQYKPVTREELSKHIDGCLRSDYNVVKQPFSCYGNVYEITLNAKGEVMTMRERWSV